MTNQTSTPTDGDTQRRKGRPLRPKDKPRPHISVPGDTLKPVRDQAGEFGMSERTFKRQFKNLLTYIAGVCYTWDIKTRQQLAGGGTSKRRSRR